MPESSRRVQERLEARARWLVRFLESRGGSVPAVEVQREARNVLDIGPTTLDKTRKHARISARQICLWELLPGRESGSNSRRFLDPGAVLGAGGTTPDPETVPAPDVDDEETSDPDADWSIVRNGEQWADCERCGAPTQTLYRGAGRCRPACPDLEAEHRRPPPRPPADRVERAEEQLRNAQERRFSPSSQPGHAWRDCSRCGWPSAELDRGGRCYKCARR